MKTNKVVIYIDCKVIVNMVKAIRNANLENNRNKLWPHTIKKEGKNIFSEQKGLDDYEREMGVEESQLGES